MLIGTQLRASGIEGLKDKIYKLKEIEFLQFLNSVFPKFSFPSIQFSLNSVLRYLKAKFGSTGQQRPGLFNSPKGIIGRRPGGGAGTRL